MDLVFKEKKMFLILALQLHKKDHCAIRPYVNKMYRLINLYYVTESEKVLMSLYSLLCKCNNHIVRLLLLFSPTKLYTIVE
ncbi:hypothetical protein AYR72_gp023 [Cnaphalocrocis medinalis granulovirus]|uniref:Uncharacterized protein n=1 Tax=Cnaphalocrocis medinalis granulovirus TaxID=1750712 RepID=A0A109WW36_9BBAC|nr:hypothetical protein AYR72_gp023 [Cnaphalocrocis medinalis granulovirus]ALN41959.1 hypothetical protein [Cnaphalocrocis medinalis granulovirus]AMF83774.1 hypothetical protein [Cnaphalocrocis medinalis granulovirus]WPN08654.1 hypothetical protein [Cnaphalocrocis medinalis granulovirus]